MNPMMVLNVKVMKIVINRHVYLQHKHVNVLINIMVKNVIWLVKIVNIRFVMEMVSVFGQIQFVIVMKIIYYNIVTLLLMIALKIYVMEMEIVVIIKKLK